MLWKKWKIEGVNLFQVIYFFHIRVTSVFYLTFVHNIIIYINILKLDLINTGFGMSIIESFKNSTYSVVK